MKGATAPFTPLKDTYIINSFQYENLVRIKIAPHDTARVRYWGIGVSRYWSN